MTYGLSLQDFLDLTPVEFDYFLYIHRENKRSELDNIEYLVRLVNTFIHNSTPFLKNNQRVKDPSKLYKISSEIQEREEPISNTRFAKASHEELSELADFLNSV